MSLTSSVQKWWTWLHVYTFEYNSNRKMKNVSFSHSNAHGTKNWPCLKIGHGQPRVMNYINLVALQTLMLHAKFQGNWPSDSGEEDFFKVLSIFEHGCHLGQAIWIIYINFCSPFPRRLNIKFGFDRPSGFREEDVWKMWTDAGRRRTTDHGYTISSPCEPEGSGELKNDNPIIPSVK